METAYQSDLPLPPEIVTLICSTLPKPDLLRLRLVTHRLHDAATPFAFRTFYLRAYGTAATNFSSIATSARLRNYVKEVTIDTNIGQDYEYASNESYEFPIGFFNAIPSLRYFYKLTKLHLRSSKYCGNNKREFEWAWIEEDWPFRWRILDTISHCMVLALGQYVFTDKRQTDWIATIGESNASGALQELYLDDCPILFKARQHSPLTSDGYPDPRAVMKDNYATAVTKEYDIKWHNVLETWRGRMKRPQEVHHGPWRLIVPMAECQSIDRIRRRGGQQYQGASIGSEIPHGAGLLQRRTARMQYLKYDIGMCWSWDNPYPTWGRSRPDDGWAPEKETVGLGDAAYELLMATIRDRT
ncbi:uncharacterized protein FFB20_01287 [Fusarium fujikuroi]|uniref:F-box domain-containing protein n=1 Tax=Gibberella fujikuroi (strain CBS 195.34 / IMI 58289 / NRRL A-6831) TaxID=1279085 RepID=S0EFQ2_GIBF5|nr:uncharacterized protein FFUJ_12568 [Fusarium fujikuroi IMI 58289]KLP08994.1 uncharacterized protein Y057_028 [Fusarium fujikuroi]CCT72677.1 uncharacterized protein FFUJ_12568 [Fusarium fujikuroi IMI 58289]SCN65070.1 uncharacterized protein FFB20_01287 [Fusarium fujikuroi]SCO13165.1 uncharacterized protein FFC1_12009 [Fusarium fujikuroi]SCO16015.1 uncharacterized protein FFE2_13518 [Fusarium fujikuroi]